MSPELGSAEVPPVSPNGGAPLRMPDGALVAKRDAPVGGQAVLEGVMMRGVSTWAVAVRRPDGALEVSSEPLVPWARRHRAWRLPVIRGVVALGESMKIGFRALAISAIAQLPEDEEGTQEEIGGWVWGATVVFSLLLAIGLFFVVPVGLTSLIKDQLGSPILFWLIEGTLRTALFVGYIAAISRMSDLRRVFEYHGAEHKTISCYEAEDELTPARAKLYSRLHPRCGTSFLLIVMVLSIFVFAPIGLPAWYWLVASRILGIPLIAGLAYEVIKWAGKHRRKRWVRAVMWPGLMLQKLTTREPDEAQLAVAIASLQRRPGPGVARGPRRSAAHRDRRVIEQLVEQIEARFAELERLMADPGVIGDRERYAEVGREYRELEPAHGLALEYRKLGNDLEGATELLQEGDDPELRKVAEEAPARGSRSSRMRSPAGDGRAGSQRLQERAGRDPGRDRGGRGGAVRRRPVQDAEPLRGGTRDSRPRCSRNPAAEVGGFKEVTFAVKGDGAYSVFKYEGGTHRVQRVPREAASPRAASIPPPRRSPCCRRPRRSRSRSTPTTSRS